AVKAWMSLCTGNPSLDPTDCAYDEDGLLHNRGNMFGPGFYAADDPVVTMSYGGGNDWVLLQVRLPVGFRYLDIREDVQSFDEGYQLFSDCPSRVGSIYSLFANLSIYALPDVCRLKIRRLLKDLLHLDGFYYDYSRTRYTQCGHPEQGAFMI